MSEPTVIDRLWNVYFGPPGPRLIRFALTWCIFIGVALGATLYGHVSEDKAFMLAAVCALVPLFYTAVASTKQQHAETRAIKRVTVQVVNLGASIVTLFYLTRTLGPEHYGLLVFAQAIVMPMTIALDAIDRNGMAELLRSSAETYDTRRFVWSVMATKIIFAGFAAVIWGLALATVPFLRQHLTLYAATFLWVIGKALLPGWAFQGLLQRADETAVPYCLAMLLSLPCLLLVSSKEDYVLAAIIQGLVPIAAALASVPLMVSTLGRPSIPSFGFIASRFVASFAVSGHAIHAFLPSFIVVLLGVMRDFSQAAQYRVALSLLHFAGYIFAPFTVPLLVHSRRFGYATLRSILKKIPKQGAVLLLLVGIVTLSAAPFVTGMLGIGFANIDSLLLMLAPVLLLNQVTTIFESQSLALGYFASNQSRLGIGLVSGIAIVAMTYKWGVIGAVAATVVYAMLQLIAMWVLVRRAHKQSPHPVDDSFDREEDLKLARSRPENLF